MRGVCLGLALVVATPASATVLYQQTRNAGGGSVSFSGSLVADAVRRNGSTWLGITGGALTGAFWGVEGDTRTLSWEIVDFDDDGNEIVGLVDNNRSYSDSCTVSVGQPTCGAPGFLLGRLQRNTVRIDFNKRDFNRCFPFDGTTGTVCSAITDIRFAQFNVEATGAGPVTLTISDTAIPGAVPEPASWALLIAGFGLTGAVLRRRRATQPA